MWSEESPKHKIRAVAREEKKNMQSRMQAAFTLIECMVAMAIASILFLATLSALSFARVTNEIEQQRCRAHQVVCQAMDQECAKLFTWTASNAMQTIWDNNTPDNPNDDTVGNLEVRVTDVATGTELTTTTVHDQLVQVEATLTWSPRLSRLSHKTFRESAMTYKAP